MSENKGGIEAELQQMSQKLQACNRSILSIITKSMHGILIVDMSKTIRFANLVAAAIFGCNADELTGKQFDYPLEPDKSVELQIKTLMGKTAIVETWTVETVWDTYQAYFVSLRDITESKRAGEALNNSEEKLRYASTAADIGMWHWDLVNNELTWSERCKEFFGFPPGYPITYEAFLLSIHEEDRQRIEEAVQKALQEKSEYFVEMRVVLPDGQVRWVMSRGRGFYDDQGKPIRMHGIAMDITERKRAEEALHKSEKKFSTIFHSVPALIGITTVAEGRCIDVNEAGLRTLGYPREEMIGRTMLELGAWESASARDRVIRIMKEDGMIRDLEINFRDKNGKTHTGLFSADPIDLNGDRYMLSIVNDITERKRMEEEIGRLNTELAARAAELEAANRELEAFNYTVAHDLRNPLNVISSYCQVLKELCSDKLDEQCRRYIQETYDGTLRMNRLIEALLNFSLLAHAETHRETVDLAAMAHEVAAELKQAEPERRVLFLIAAGVSANVDADLLRVVLANLLGNAWKYTATREEGVIEFGTTEIDGKPAWFVRDNGNGFNMADADKLFVPFQRLPGADECRGHGIGLATVEKVIKRHGGRVWAEGVPGKGACFYFTLSANEVTT